MNFRTYILFSDNLKEAKKELEKVGGHTLISLTENVFLVNLPSAFEPSQLTFSTHKQPEDLDLVSSLMIEVWRQWKPSQMQDILSRVRPQNIEGIPEVTEIQNMKQIS